MIDYIVAAITALLLLVGALFALAAAIGLVRLPDLYTRMHSASKAGTVGSGLLLLAAKPLFARCGDSRPCRRLALSFSC